VWLYSIRYNDGKGFPEEYYKQLAELSDSRYHVGSPDTWDIEQVKFRVLMQTFNYALSVDHATMLALAAGDAFAVSLLLFFPLSLLRCFTLVYYSPFLIFSFGLVFGSIHAQLGLVFFGGLLACTRYAAGCFPVSLGT
jgi:hypothetical protein